MGPTGNMDPRWSATVERSAPLALAEPRKWRSFVGQILSLEGLKVPQGRSPPSPAHGVILGFVMEIKVVPVEIPEGANVIIGQSHFIKTVEDIYEAIVNTNPQMKFGVAFNEASGPCLVRADGNDESLKRVAVRNASAIGAGHVFVVMMTNGFPINVLGRIQQTPEVCRVFCASANPVQVVVAQTELGRGILGVIDGASPKGIEGDEDIQHRKDFLRKIGYKR